MLATKKRVVILLPCIFLVLGLYIYCQPAPPPRPLTHNGVLDKFPAKTPNREHLFDGSWNYLRDRDNLMLTQDQCDQAFPDLYTEIDRARQDRRSRPITLKELDAIPARNGYIRAMIYDQQVTDVFACF